MINEQLAGVWTYRSFLNVPEEVGDFNKIKFGEGELVFEMKSEPGTIRGQLAFRSEKPDPKDARLFIHGSIEKSNLRFQGTGVNKTDAEGWVYDYNGEIIPNWIDGTEKKTIVTGTVIRSVPHDGKPAGVVGSFIAVKHEFLEPSHVIPLPENVLSMLSTRMHRLHHSVWHSVRDRWTRLDETKKNEIRKRGWQPGEIDDERPSITPYEDPIVLNGSGEDFLFMHRKMIMHVNSMMTEPIKGWSVIPAPGPYLIEPKFDNGNISVFPPGNPDGFTVPPLWITGNEEFDRRNAQLKSDGHYWSRMKWWDRNFKNFQYLATLTLYELGSLIEWSVHNDMHIRWASVPRDKGLVPISTGRDERDIDALKWDRTSYDFLGDTYSAHVNPVFWRLHGWVDDRINDWFEAHETVHRGQIEKIQIDGVPWFKSDKWVFNDRPWDGPIHSHSDDHSIAKMEEVNEIIYGVKPQSFELDQHRSVPPLTWF
ncbi:hypothetical protein MF628_003278 [Paenibacillus polymyxa]|uniref:hypothetical protein n=1 Tax=Paenibacillus polymyxa TaxID=1406 RepID=UPI00202512F1|nr:hypothetical protein [Paenibacillus polymyxa]URJ43645.1 hypothetical protein MF628_003278 [Paenibacillus polymyxa]